MSDDQASGGRHDSQVTNNKPEIDVQSKAIDGSEPDPEQSTSTSSENIVNEQTSEEASKDESDDDSENDDSEDDDESEDDSMYDSEDDERYGRYVAPKKTLSQLAEEAVLKSLTKAIDGEQTTARYCCGGSIPAVVPKHTNSEIEVEVDVEVAGEKKKDEDNVEGRNEKKDEKKGEKKDEKKKEDENEKEVEKEKEKEDEKEDVREHEVVEESFKDGEKPKDGTTLILGAVPKVQVAPPVTIRWDCAINEAVTRRLTIVADTPLPFEKRSPIWHLSKACGLEGLEQSRFTIDLHPQDHGIIDALSQILLPGYKGNFLSNMSEHRGVKVGTCRMHVSTAAVESKIRVKSKPSSLAILLSVCQLRGDVTVSDDGHSSVFDWSGSMSHSIHWIALTKNCAIEKSPVTVGTQILLIYDLLVTKRVGDGVGSGNIVDPKLTPLYQGVKDSLLQPGFMKTGGTLAYYCRHPYSHTSLNMAKRLPAALQGVDMAFYSVFKSLGLMVQVRPIIDPGEIATFLEERYEREYGDDYDGSDYYDQYEGRMAMHRRFQGAKVGNAFHDLSIGYFKSTSNDGEEYSPASFNQGLKHNWSMKERHGIDFLNTPYSGGKKPRELAVVLMEDESEDDMMYSYGRDSRGIERLHSLVGILVTVPKFADRVLEL